MTDLEHGAADAVAIADADFVIGKTFDGQVFAELAMLEVVAAKMCRPMPLRVELVDHHGALLSAVPVQVGLAVAVDVQAARDHSARHRPLPYRRTHEAALPLHLPGQPDVDGHQLQFMRPSAAGDRPP